METKTCSKCGTEKDNNLFDRGHNQCKQCLCDYNKIDYVNTKDHRKALYKKRKEANPKKLAALSKVRVAIKKGDIIVPNVCESNNCNTDGYCGTKLEAHHENYDEPLIVVHLCRSCHMNVGTGKSDKADNIRKRVKEIFEEKLLISKG